jgi:hypothetical protein
MAEVSTEWGEAFAEWLAARAAMAKSSIDLYASDASSEEQDAVFGKMNDRLIAAERRLVEAPTTARPQLLEKFEVLRTMLFEREIEGPPSDRRHLMSWRVSISI